MKVGTVKFFHEQKGYGFIQQPNDDDIFVHISEVRGGQALTKDQAVTFDVGEGKKGPCAVNVELSAIS